MRVLIAYAGKTGTTRKCAAMLAKKFPVAFTMDLDVDKELINTDYDLIIIGSNVRMGALNRNVKTFISNNRELLLERKFALFACCAFVENVNQYFQNNVPKNILEHAIVYDTFGGEINLKELNGLEKTIVKTVLSRENRVIEIDEEKIEKFYNLITKE